MIWHLHINKSANLYTILKYLTVYSLKCLPFKIICSLLQKRSIAFISNLSQRCVPPYRVAFSVKESNILYIFISFEVQLLGVLAPPPSTHTLHLQQKVLELNLFFVSFHRIDVTEVQITITMLLLITAYGGTGLWDYKVSVFKCSEFLLSVLSRVHSSCDIWSCSVQVLSTPPSCVMLF